MMFLFHRKLKRTGSLLCLVLLSLSCSTEAEDVNPDCKNNVIIDNALFESVDTSGYEVKAARILEDCLEVTITAGGCDGNSWVVELIDADRVTETAIVQRDLKISLQNPELCLALVTRTFSFNLQPIQTSDEEIILNLENWEDQLNYTY